uniref:Uncharacterized protein n=1 Tax=Molossus molossus TaxID=27622 RepID=A0A7J8HI30_MOLMO|nr:hypothetical protein HJG59_011059 [Molossus molossus]
MGTFAFTGLTRGQSCPRLDFRLPASIFETRTFCPLGRAVRGVTTAGLAHEGPPCYYGWNETWGAGGRKWAAQRGGRFGTESSAASSQGRVQEAAPVPTPYTQDATNWPGLSASLSPSPQAPAPLQGLGDGPGTQGSSSHTHRRDMTTSPFSI